MKNNQKGFSLIELLVVVVIIGIIAAIAIPSLLASRRAANEAAAISTLRTIMSAQATYQSTTGLGNNYGSLPNLLTDGLIDSVLGASDAPTKGNYDFAHTLGTGATTFCTTAIPAASSGTRSFALSQEGVIYQTLSATVPPSCDEDTGIVSTGSPL